MEKTDISPEEFVRTIYERGCFQPEDADFFRRAALCPCHDEDFQLILDVDGLPMYRTLISERGKIPKAFLSEFLASGFVVDEHLDQPDYGFVHVRFAG